MQPLLSEQELAICRQLGVLPEEFQQTKQKELKSALCSENGLSFEEAQAKVMKLFGISPAEASRIMMEEKAKMDAQAPLSTEEVKVCRLLKIEPLDYYDAKQKESGI